MARFIFLYYPSCPDRPLISFDYAAKTVLRDPANFGILSGFLSELLNKDVAVQEILESESLKVIG